MEKLSTKEHWENNWNNTELPARFNTDYSNRVISDKIVRCLGATRPKKILEIGGCPGRWSDFFFREYGCQCDIVDYEENGCKATEENYRLLNIKGDVYCQDIFKHTLPLNSYDLVMSAGLVEHFTEIEPIFTRHLDLAKNGGLLVIGVPNIFDSKSYNRVLKMYGKEAIHRRVSREELAKAATQHGLEILYCDYLGVIGFGLMKRLLFKNSVLRRLSGPIFYLLDRLLFIVPIKKEGSQLSPKIYLIARKVAASGKK